MANPLHLITAPGILDGLACWSSTPLTGGGDRPMRRCKKNRVREQKRWKKIHRKQGRQ